MWDLIVSVPDHCLSFYFAYALLVILQHFLVTTQLVEKHMLILSKKAKITNFLLTVSRIQCDFAAREFSMM